MRKNIFAVLLILYAIILMCPVCFAQDNSICSQDEWDPSSVGPVAGWTAPLCAKGEFAVQPFFFYSKTRGTFNDSGHYDNLPEGDKKYQYQEQLFAQYGITDRLEIDGQIVYQQNYVKQGDLSFHESGLGDSYLFLRYCFKEEEKFLPCMTAVYQLKAPTGKYQHADPDKLGTDIMDNGLSGGSWDNGLGVIFTKRINPFILHADATYNFTQKVKVDDVKTDYANYLSYDAGIEYFLPKGFNLMFELNGYLQGQQKQDGEKIAETDSSSITISPGIGWSCDKFQTLIAYQRILAGKNTDANDSVVLTCIYTF